jgi:tetratricopeptide (TPR) repeat protein
MKYFLFFVALLVFSTGLYSEDLYATIKKFMKYIIIIAMSFIMSLALTVSAHSKEPGKSYEDFLRGREFLSKGMFSYSSSIFTEVCSKEDSPDCWNHLGVSFMGQKQYKTALEFFQKAVEKERLSRYLSNMGLAYFYLKDWENAHKCYGEAVGLDNTNYNARINLAILEARNGDSVEGEKQLIRILAENGDLFYARLHLGIIYYGNKKYHDALIEFNKGIELNTKSDLLYLHRAYTYYQLKDYDAAEMDLNQVEILNPGDPKAAKLRSLIEIKRGYNR